MPGKTLKIFHDLVFRKFVKSAKIRGIRKLLIRGNLDHRTGEFIVIWQNQSDFHQVIA